MLQLVSTSSAVELIQPGSAPASSTPANTTKTAVPNLTLATCCFFHPPRPSPIPIMINCTSTTNAGRQETRRLDRKNRLPFSLIFPEGKQHWFT